MNIFFLEWNSFENEDMYEIWKDMGHHVISIPFRRLESTKEEMEDKMCKALQQATCDFLFSFNYFPMISELCQKYGIKYVSWVYDSPYIHVFSYTVINACNYIFLFDHAMYEELKNAGISTVYYLPLGVNSKRMKRLAESNRLPNQKYRSEISFVGGLYTEQKQQLYQKFQGVNDYTKGYLDGLLQAQMCVQGYNFLQEMLTEDVLQEMEKAYPTDPNASTVLPPAELYADYVLARQVTALERQKILELLGREHEVKLYTYNTEKRIPGTQNMGKVDYYLEMPYVFRNTKINLNITLRSIKTGIPLRAWDIMGNGGFLMTNYQAELLDYFEPGTDFVYYEDMDDLQEKVSYYLQHEEERKNIAKNAMEKVCREHDLRSRVSEILKIVMRDET